MQTDRYHSQTRLTRLRGYVRTPSKGRPTPVRTRPGPLARPNAATSRNATLAGVLAVSLPTVGGRR
jgi:hypothetical protein